MNLPLSRVLTDFPYPVAYPYRLVFDPALAASQRRWALCFTEYQLLRTVCLPLVSQYLRDEIDRTAKDSIGALNRAIAAIRSPFFSDWIALLYNLRRHLSRVGIRPVFPQLAEALNGLQETAERPVGLRGNHRLAPLVDDAEGRMTHTGQFVGTVRYASPEQLLSVARLDRRNDVYRLLLAARLARNC